jgi:filamentous hemagglutinin
LWHLRNFGDDVGGILYLGGFRGEVGIVENALSRGTELPSITGAITGRVATRINLANGPTRFTPLRSSGSPVSAGWQHVLEGHFNRPVTANRSVFTISPGELRSILQSPEVVRSPVGALGDGHFFRIVDTGRTIGVSSVRNGGTATSVLKVFTDEAGNLITAFPL